MVHEDIYIPILMILGYLPNGFFTESTVLQAEDNHEEKVCYGKRKL